MPLARILSTIAVLLAFAAGPHTVRAADFGIGTVRNIANTHGVPSAIGFGSFVRIRHYIINIAKLAAYVISAVALLAIIYGGVLYVSSAGDESQAKKAKTSIMYAAIGLIIAGLSAALVNLVLTL
ncbi:MAG: hypothetical protein COT71_02425 [Candidatus Andersenbacteria bacterium CG10_big_fil_rev_8_21_14_0_10_54_11]|uniref:TrbC/VIRB2 family protein n=1 Tax=Candidatus Andersenbacteria bacterium CG10_big_fil_rev_8_21_14_0_10_54_11 TaxID=1974485 RepID=A0A2M6WZC1_9BACT|nr:MAG: hypothetical protein COT71_02425 [Candidatus Andersenbacteria bacterium CG10_big_fil_rev_8_21_14_0_10_54_11]